jgi:hypothetical protein
VHQRVGELGDTVVDGDDPPDGDPPGPVLAVTHRHDESSDSRQGGLRAIPAGH